MAIRDVELLPLKGGNAKVYKEYRRDEMHTWYQGTKVWCALYESY